MLAVLAVLVVLDGTLLASLPRLDGSRHTPGLNAAVRIERDALGVPTIEAANRLDLAYGTGFVHAQDRFFQMDLSRRLAAGELAELFGAVALDEDRRTRLFRLRSVARAVLAGATEPQRALLEAYARGVNDGLAALTSRPWEYWVLGAPPAPWRPEDTALVEYAMWWDLQSGDAGYERLRQEVNARLKGPECGAGWKCALAFFYPARTVWDAPVGGEPPAAPAAIPPPEVLDVRGASAQSPAPAKAAAPAQPRAPVAGSNNWAVIGRLTTTGSALVANDMHLSQRVPAVWYHARLRVTGSAAAPGLDLTGVTLPGTPLLVAGSNTHIAWGFTNSAGTWTSLTRLPCSAVGETELTTAAGTQPLAVARELIHVKGGTDQVLAVKSGPAGVLWQADPQRQLCWFVGWLAQLPEATNLNLLDLEQVTSVAAALDLAPTIGIPHENFVVGDRDGHIGWSIAGRIPDDAGPARALGGVPWTTAADHPRLLDPPGGRIWTANARVAVDARALALIGGADASFGARYDLGARARQIRADLFAGGNLKPADMLKMQLDDRALFLTRWRGLLLHLLDDASIKGKPQRAEFRRLVEGWNAHAAVDSAGYRLVRSFHDRTQQAVWEMLLTALAVPHDYDAAPPEQFEGPLWELVSRQPLHLLAREYPDWRAFLTTQLDATIEALGGSCPQLAACTWGERNTVRIRHPLSRALPWLARFLDMPVEQLPGDHDMPRVQDHAFGASERFAVSPGHEDQGYLELPGGASGHPLSPYYRAGFGAWARGEPLPFLPGPARHLLVLTPQ